MRYYEACVIFDPRSRKFFVTGDVNGRDGHVIFPCISLEREESAHQRERLKALLQKCSYGYRSHNIKAKPSYLLSAESFGDSDEMYHVNFYQIDIENPEDTDQGRWISAKLLLTKIEKDHTGKTHVIGYGSSMGSFVEFVMPSVLEHFILSVAGEQQLVVLPDLTTSN